MSDVRLVVLVLLTMPGAVAGFGCSREVRAIEPAHAHAEVESHKLDPVVSEPVSEAAPSGSAPMEHPPAAPPEKAPGVSRPLDQLGPFYDAIDALRNGERTSPVRVLWLGDSHTAADFMTHPVRIHLAALASDGGPGFVRLGLDGNRHGAVRFSESGKWRKAPILPSQRTRVLDGIFGYGGIRTLPAAGASSTLELRAPRDEAFRWALSYRLPEGAKLSVKWGEELVIVSGDTETSNDFVAFEAASHGDVRTAVFQGRAREPFTVSHVGGDPQIFGAFGEYVAPGVVLDTVGINGARAATVLAWEPEQYVDQLGRRSPDLLVLAFGTNEVFDQTNVERYEEHLTKVVAMGRATRPELPCWIVGPPDSANTGGGSKERVSQVTGAFRRAAAAAGCAFTSAFELMGGEGSFSAWARERPARARGDRIHLTISGYESLGQMLAQALVPTDEGMPALDPALVPPVLPTAEE